MDGSETGAAACISNPPCYYDGEFGNFSIQTKISAHPLQLKGTLFGVKLARAHHYWYLPEHC